MPKFQFRALAANGAVITGKIDAPSRSEVIARLQELGHFPIAASEGNEVSPADWLKRNLIPAGGMSLRDLAIVTQQLLTLLEAGLAIDRALELLIDLTKGGALRSTLNRLVGRVRNGEPLSVALASEGEKFPKIYVGLVRAGEASGSLKNTLGQLVSYLSRANATRETIRSALIYPALLLVTAAVSVGAILLFILPQFEPLFQESGRPLPAATQVIVDIGDFLRAYWWALLTFGGIAWFMVRHALAHKSVCLAWHRWVLRLPLFGELIAKIEVARFARTLGTLLACGVTLPQALTITRDTLLNTAIADAVARAVETLKQGQGLSAPLARSKMFPSLALQFIRVGEESGRLDEVLIRQADIFDAEVQQTVQRLLTLLTPMLTMVLGALVAGIIASMMLAILSINDLAF